MKVSILVQQRGDQKHQSIRDRLADTFGDGECSHVRVGVAYATVSGVRELLSAIPGNKYKSKWLLGLDDFLTQPGALDLVRRLPNAELRVPLPGPPGTRFHPKVYYFSQSSPLLTDVMVVGSANLTRAALLRNSEAVSIITADRNSGTSLLRTTWRGIWSQGQKVTEEFLEQYRADYDAALHTRPKPPTSPEPVTGLILATDGAEVDPAVADLCWIECGNVTAMGRELEFKAEQALFFGLQPAGGRTATFRFITSDEQTVRLTLKYQENHMWRLQLNNNVPEVRVGLRPKSPDGRLERSALVAVFQRTLEHGTFRLSFLHEESDDYAALRSRCAVLGTLGRTSARQYGWC